MKTAIVTGGSRGIGRAIALRLAADGYAVMIAYKNNKEAAEEVVSEIRKNGGCVAAERCDVSNSVEAADLISLTYDTFGGLNLLVNNAGIASVKLFTDCTDEDFADVIGTDLMGTLNCSRAALGIMLRRHSGKIINISSMWGEVGASAEVVYSAAKAGVIGFTKALAKEVAPSGITVNCVSPGVVDTDMMSGFTEEEVSALVEEIPLCRIASTDDIANAVAFLASDGADYITGQVLSVNGGMVV